MEIFSIDITEHHHLQPTQNQPHHDSGDSGHSRPPFHPPVFHRFSSTACVDQHGGFGKDHLDQKKRTAVTRFGCCFGGDKKTGARYEQCEDDHHSGPMDDLRGGLSFEGWMDVSRPGFCRVALAAKLIIHCSQSYFSAGFLSAVLVFDPLNPIRDPQYLLCGLCISRMEYISYIYKKWFLNPSFRICHCLVHTIGSCQFCKKTSTSQLLDKMYHTHLNYVRICPRS